MLPPNPLRMHLENWYSNIFIIWCYHVIWNHNSKFLSFCEPSRRFEDNNFFFLSNITYPVIMWDRIYQIWTIQVSSSLPQILNICHLKPFQLKFKNYSAPQSTPSMKCYFPGSIWNMENLGNLMTLLKLPQKPVFHFNWPSNPLMKVFWYVSICISFYYLTLIWRI